jgi:hypothetical protein
MPAEEDGDERRARLRVERAALINEFVAEQKSVHERRKEHPARLLDAQQRQERIWLRARKHRIWATRQGDYDMRKDLKQWFDYLDADGSGEISVDELEDPLVSMGLCHSREEVQKLVAAVDWDGSGMVGFEEFVDIVLSQDTHEQTEEEEVAAAAAAAAAAEAAAAGKGKGKGEKGKGATAAKTAPAPASTSAGARAQQQQQQKPPAQPAYAAHSSPPKKAGAATSRGKKSKTNPIVQVYTAMATGQLGDPNLGVATLLTAYRRRLLLDGLMSRGVAETEFESEEQRGAAKSLQTKVGAIVQSVRGRQEREAEEEAEAEERSGGAGAHAQQQQQNHHHHHHRKPLHHFDASKLGGGGGAAAAAAAGGRRRSGLAIGPGFAQGQPQFHAAVSLLGEGGGALGTQQEVLDASGAARGAASTREGRRARHEFHMDDYDVMKRRRRAVTGAPRAFLGRYALRSKRLQEEPEYQQRLDRAEAARRKEADLVRRGVRTVEPRGGQGRPRPPGDVTVHTYAPGEATPHATRIRATRTPLTLPREQAETLRASDAARQRVADPTLGAAYAAVGRVPPRLEPAINRRHAMLHLDRPIGSEVRERGVGVPMFIKSQFGLGIGNWGYTGADPNQRTRNEKARAMKERSGASYRPPPKQ